MIATTRVTILRGTTTDEFGDTVDTDTEAGTDGQTGIPASLVEQTRTATTRDDLTPRVVRYTVGRLPAGTDIGEDDRLRDDRTGRTYIVTAVSRPTGIGITPDLRVDLKLTN